MNHEGHNVMKSSGGLWISRIIFTFPHTHCYRVSWLFAPLKPPVGRALTEYVFTSLSSFQFTFPFSYPPVSNNTRLGHYEEKIMQLHISTATLSKNALTRFSIFSLCASIQTLPHHNIHIFILYLIVSQSNFASLSLSPFQSLYIAVM